MRNLLAFLAAVALTFLGVGWCLGWYKIQSTPTGAGHRSLSIDVNTDKMNADLQKGTAKISKLLEKKGEDGKPLHADVPGTPPGNPTNR